VLLVFVAAMLAFGSCRRWPLFGKGVGDEVTFVNIQNTTTLIAERESRGSYSLSVSISGTTLVATYSASSLTNGFLGIFPAGVYTTNVFQYVSSLSGSVTLSTAGLAGGSYDVYLVSNGLIVDQVAFSIGGGTNPSAAPSASPAAGSSSTGSSSSADIQSWLTQHNTRRASYGVPALAWSAPLASIAQNWANNMAAQSSLYHSGTYGVGENIAYGYSSIPAVLVAWADNEEQYYDASTQQCNGGVCGHFTQVAWASTTLVGCGIANSAAGWPYYSCNYIRPGNCNNYNWQQTNSPCPYFSDSSL